MISKAAGFLLPAGLLLGAAFALAGCGGGSSALPASVGTLTPAALPIAQRDVTAALGSTSPAFVQSFARADASNVPATTIAVTLGTSGSAGVAPSSSDDLIAIVAAFGSGKGQHPATPAGWTAISGGSVTSNGWSTIDAYRLPAGSAIPSAVTFGNFGGTAHAVEAAVTIVEVTHSGGVEVVASGGVAGSGTAQPYSASTGNGTATGAGELPIVAGNIDDCCLSASTVSGFTQLGLSPMRGDGSNSFGGETRVLYGALTTSTAVGSTALPFTGDSGTYTLAGLKVLVIAQAPAPSPTPSAAPTVAGCGAVPAFQNGVEYAATWAPYNCASSPWNLRVSASPTYATNSSALIASEFGSGNTQPVRDQEAGPYDYGHPVYFASASDPLVTLRCTAYCNHSDNGGYPSTVHVPAQARPAGGSDAHMAVIQPDGTEIDLWATTAPSGNWTNGSTVTAQAIANCGSFTSGSGFTPSGPAATAGGACLGAGLLRANELQAGAIGHALFLITQCAVGWQYPTFPNATTDRCTSGQGPALGGRLWYDVADATTNANPNLKPWEKAILNALHDFGGYVQDDVGGGSGVSGIAFLAESGEAAWAFGQTDPFAALTSQGWSRITIGGAFTPRYAGADPWQPSGVNFAAHLHWLDACSAHGSC